eukprot:scaffold201654_cov27-Tisochrysis_lutea.AAC.2
MRATACRAVPKLKPTAAILFGRELQLRLPAQRLLIPPLPLFVFLFSSWLRISTPIRGATTYASELNKKARG